MIDDKPRIATLQLVDIRQAWAHEAQDFTPWLYANLDALGEAVGISLDGEGIEVAVDTFSADILARNRFDDSRVLIENQLAVSDHPHLGQIMTYLAGLEAKTIIWVATDFRPAHLSALKWLNDHTDDGFSFFAVKVKVVRIEQSPFAPIFEVLERPNQWERQLQAANPVHRDVGERSQQRYAFWQAFIDRVPGELERGGPAQATSNRWRELKDLDLAISMYAAQGDVGLFIRAPRSGDHLGTRERLESVREALTTKLGVEMSNSDQYFFGSRSIGNYNDPLQRDQLIDWLASKAEQYESSIREVL